MQNTEHVEANKNDESANKNQEQQQTAAKLVNYGQDQYVNTVNRDFVSVIGAANIDKIIEEEEEDEDEEENEDADEENKKNAEEKNKTDTTINHLLANDEKNQVLMTLQNTDNCENQGN